MDVGLRSRSFGNVLNLCESVEFIYNVLKIKTVIFYTKKICVFIIIRQRILLHFMSKKKIKIGLVDFGDLEHAVYLICYICIIEYKDRVYLFTFV